MTRTYGPCRAPLGRALLLGVALLVGIGQACRSKAGPTGTPAVRDGLGRIVAVPKSPHRIVSLAPSVTASLLALGASERLVGVSDYCVLPPGTTSIVRVGGLLNPSLETIRALRPDLLIGTTSGNDPALARQAETLGLPLYTIDTPDVERVLLAVNDLARLLGEEGRGDGVVRGLRARLEAVRSRVAARRPPRLLFIVWSDPLVVPGRTAFLTDALARAGGDSVTADARAAWPSFDVESAIARAPEVILTTTQNRGLLDRLRRDAAWARVPALLSGRLMTVGESIEQPGPGVVAGIEEVARALHPDAFGGTGGEPRESSRPSP